MCSTFFTLLHKNNNITIKLQTTHSTLVLEQCATVANASKNNSASERTPYAPSTASMRQQSRVALLPLRVFDLCGKLKVQPSMRVINTWCRSEVFLSNSMHDDGRDRVLTYGTHSRKWRYNIETFQCLHKWVCSCAGSKKPRDGTHSLTHSHILVTKREREKDENEIQNFMHYVNRDDFHLRSSANGGRGGHRKYVGRLTTSQECVVRSAHHTRHSTQNANWSHQHACRCLATAQSQTSITTM